MNKSLLGSLPSSTSGSSCPGHPCAPAARQTGFPATFLLAHLLAGCGGGSGDAPPVSDPDPPPPPVAAAITHGHYRGLSTIDGQAYHAEAVLTVDGEFRLFVGGAVHGGSGPPSGAGLTGTLLLTPEESMQFSGRLALAGSEGTGTGLVTGEACGAANEGRFCGISAIAEVRLDGLAHDQRAGLTGEIRTASRAGVETWMLELSAWSIYYRSTASLTDIGGAFSEKLAPFARDDEVILSFDGAGRLFFQGPATGCTGNGVFSPHLDGEFFVFDVELLIENCNAPYDVLNSRFTGLATATQDGYWSYDYWLAVFLSTPEPEETPVALTMYAEPLPGWDY